MKSITPFTAALQLMFLVGENLSVVQSFETPQYLFRTSFLVAKNDVRRSSFSYKSPRGMTSKPEEYDDGIGDVVNRKTNSEGEDLVAEFYKSLQERNDLGDSGNDPSFDLGKSPSSTGISSGNLFEPEETKPERKIKFTGRPMDGSDYFGTSNSLDSGNPVRDNMMRREYELVSGATSRSAITFQAGLALTMLIFFLYVGLSGGIVSGDAALVDYGGDDMIQFEQIIPIPRDSDQSVWI